MTDGLTERPTDREIKQTVVERYGARARAALGELGVQPASEAACCAPGDAPGESAGASQPLQLIELGSTDAAGGFCAPGDESCELPVAEGASADEALYGDLYGGTDLGELPDAAVQASAGCGNPVAIAEMRPGEAVLDLGSGGGIDCFLAAGQVGAGGEVWGLDMTPDMVQLARRNADQVEATNVRFRLGEIEDMPFEGDKFDVVISNCVINLSTDKEQVFREAARVLRPGGRLRVSDIVLTRALPPEVANDVSQWAGCVAGALPVDDYLGLIRAAGFTDVRAEYEDNERGIASAYVSAVSPA